MAETSFFLKNVFIIVIVQRAVVQMDESREQHITELLNSVQSDQREPGRGSRGAVASDSWRPATSKGHW